MEENETREEIIISLAEKLVSRKKVKILLVAIVFISLVGLIFIIPPLCFKFVQEGDNWVVVLSIITLVFFLFVGIIFIFTMKKFLLKTRQGEVIASVDEAMKDYRMEICLFLYENKNKLTVLQRRGNKTLDLKAETKKTENDINHLNEYLKMFDEDSSKIKENVVKMILEKK